MKVYGFGRKERLKKTREFTQVLRGGKKISGKFFSLYFREATGTSESIPRYSRLGIVIPKRVIKKAHDRNRLKRFVREIFRLEKNRLNQPIDLVMRLHTCPEKIGFSEMKQELTDLLGKAKLFL